MNKATITRNLLTLLLSIVITAYVYSQNYYVAVGGNNVLSTSQQAPGDLVYTALNAPKNATIYVKAGNYGSVNVVVGSDSISLIGYNNTPGDISSNNIPTTTSQFYSNNYNNFPTLDGNDKTSGGYAIYSSGKDGVLIKNFYIKNYAGATSTAGDGNIYENLIADGFGNPQSFYHGWGYSHYGNYNEVKNCFLLNAGAQGITVKGNYNLVEDSYVFADDTTAYAPTDYYILVTANSSTSEAKYNKVRNCKVERIGNLKHSGHGLCLTTFYIHQSCSTNGYCYNPIYKDDMVQYNTIENCTSINIGEPVLLRGAGVQNNKINRVVSENYGGLTITSGAKFNTFTNCLIKDPYYREDSTSSSIYFNAGVEFFASGWGDTTDQNVNYTAQGTYPWEQAVCGEGNKFINCVFQNVGVGINLSSYSEFYDNNGNPVDREGRKIVKDNDFVNCTFVGRSDSLGYLFMAMRGNEGNRMINCIINNFPHYEGRYFAKNQSNAVLDAHSIIPTYFIYDHCNFYNNVFDSQIPINGNINPTPTFPTILEGTRDSIAGTFINVNVADPGFVNLNSGDYHLSNCGNCGTIDKGNSIAQMNALGYGNILFDIDSASRPCNNYDIGAYEYTDPCITSVEENLLNNEIKIYPNPANNVINLVSSENNNSTITIYNVVGSIQKQLKHNQHTTIDISDLKPGIYLLEYNKQVHKFIKQ